MKHQAEIIFYIFQVTSSCFYFVPIHFAATVCSSINAQLSNDVQGKHSDGFCIRQELYTSALVCIIERR